MYIDYDFYKNIYLGDKITIEQFPKFAELSEAIISRYTMDRVNDNTINKYPKVLIDKIKKCGCELIDFNYTVDNVTNLLTPNNSGTVKLEKSKKAGEVSVTYDTSIAISYYTDQKNINKKYKSILNNFLYPQIIGDKFFNLLSWVGGNVYTNYYTI